MSRMVMLPSREEIESPGLAEAGRLRPWVTPYDPTNVIRHLAQYLGLTEEGVEAFVYRRDPRKPLADLWMEQNPRSQEDFHAYYSSETGYYLWDLAAFNTSLGYWALRVRKTWDLRGKIVDFGGGIGSLSIALTGIETDVCYVDLPSPQRRFAEWRFKLLHLPISVVSSLQEVEEADNVVVIDVMEHLHPDELPKVCHEFARILQPLRSRTSGGLPQGGVVYATDEFGANSEWPMHQDTRQLFEDSMLKEGFRQKEAQTWMKT